MRGTDGGWPVSGPGPEGSQKTTAVFERLRLAAAALRLVPPGPGRWLVQVEDGGGSSLWPVPEAVDVELADSGVVRTGAPGTVRADFSVRAANGAGWVVTAGEAVLVLVNGQLPGAGVILRSGDVVSAGPVRLVFLEVD